MKKPQQHQQQQETPFRLPSDRRLSLLEKRDAYGRTLLDSPQQPRREQEQQQTLEQQDHGRGQKSTTQETHMQSPSQQRQSFVERSKEERQKEDGSSAFSRSGIPAALFLGALWPSFPGVAVGSESLNQEGIDRDNSNRCNKEGGRFHSSDSSSNAFAAFFPRLGAGTTERSRTAAGGRIRCPSRAPPADGISSFPPSSPRLEWSAAGLSSVASLPRKASSFFAAWLPTPAGTTSSTTPHAVASAVDTSRRCTSAADTEAVQRSAVHLGSSEEAEWISCNNASSSTSDCRTGFADEKGDTRSSRQAAEPREGACSAGTYKAHGVAAPRNARLRQRTSGIRFAAVGRYQRGDGFTMEAEQQDCQVNGNSTLALAQTPARTDSRRVDADSSAVAGAYAGTPAADGSAVVQSEEREVRGRNAVATRRRTAEANEWREQHASGHQEESDRSCPRHGDQGTAEGGNVETVTPGRDMQRDTRAQRSRPEHSGEKRSAQFFFGIRGPRSLRTTPMLQREQQRQQPSSKREVVAAGAQACSRETLGTKEGKRESSGREAGEDAASSGSFGWMDQLRKVLRQTTLLGGSSATATKDVPSRLSSVSVPGTTSEETGTEEELSDTELLLLQGVSIGKLPEEYMQHASHGSEPCNVLVCVESPQAACASSPPTVVEAAAVCDAAGEKTAVQVAVAPAAPPPSTRSSGTSSTRTSGEASSGLWEGTSFLPPSLASLAAAVNLRPWLAADTAPPSTPPTSEAACADTPCSGSNSSNYGSSNSSSQTPLLTGRVTSERSTVGNSSSSARSSHPGTATVEQREVAAAAGEDFESLFRRCRSSVTNEADSAATTTALPLHAVAVLRSDGSSRTYWRVPAPAQQQQQQDEKQQPPGKWHDQQQNRRSEPGQYQPQAGKQTTASGEAAEEIAREQEAREWMFIPLQQPAREPVQQPQRPEVEQHQQEVHVKQSGDQRGQLQRRRGSAETTVATARAEHQHSDDRQQQLHNLAEGSRSDSSSSSKSCGSDTRESVPHLDAWSGINSASVVATTLPIESSYTQNRDSVGSSESRISTVSGSANSRSRRARISQQVIGRKVADLTCPVGNKGESDARSLQPQENVQMQQMQHQQEEAEDRTSTTAPSGSAEELKSTKFPSSNNGTTGTERGARSWSQSQYNTTQHRSSKGMQLQQQDLSPDAATTAEGQQGSAVDHSLGKRRKDTRSTLTLHGAESGAVASLTESSTAALGIAGAATNSAAETPLGTPKAARERNRQPQSMGWWAEFSKGVTDFFTQQQGVLLPDVDVRHCENSGSPASSGCATFKQQEEEASPALSPLYAPLGFSFSPAGLLGPYHLGVVSLLCEANIINEYTPVAGASAGSLAAVTIGLNLSAATVMSSIEQVNQDLKEKGTAQRLGKRLRKELNKMIPDDCATIIAKRPGKVTVTYTHVFPYIHGAFVSSFFGKSDLIDCLMASCNIPFYFSKWPTITCRGRQCVDGFFATKHKTFGCPETGALRDVKVVPFYASTVRVSSAAQDCINPDLQLHDQQILHYLRAKALLRVRAGLLREQMKQQQRQQRQEVRPQAAEGKQHAPPQDHQQHPWQRRLSACALDNTGTGSSVVNSCLPLLPSVCPLHGAGREGKEHHRVFPEGTGIHKKFQSTAEEKVSNSGNASPADRTESTGVESQRIACVLLSSTQTEDAGATRARSSTEKQHRKSRSGAGPAAAVGVRESGTFSEGGASPPCTSLFLASPPCTRAADAAGRFPRTAASFPAFAAGAAASVSEDGPSIPARVAASSTCASLLPLELPSASAAVVPGTAAATVPPCGATFPAAAAALPAAAAVAAEAAAQRGEEVCAFESIYACPVCSPLGEICPPHHFSYYYHDPSSASFGCGTITTSASFNVEHDVAGPFGAPASSAGTSTRPDTARSPSAAASSRTTDTVASTPARAERAAAAPPSAAASGVPANGDATGSRMPNTAMPRRSSSNNLIRGAMPAGTAVPARQIEELARGKGPAGPVASLTALGAASGLLKTAAEGTPGAVSFSKENGVNGKNRSEGSGGSNNSDSKAHSSEKVTGVSVPLPAAVSSIVSNATDAAGQCSSETDTLTSSPAARAPAPESDASANAVDVCTSTNAAAAPPESAVTILQYPRATNTTLSYSSTFAGKAAAAGAPLSAAQPPATALPAVEAAGLTAPAVAVSNPAAAAPPAAAGFSPRAATSSAARNLARTGTTARQRRRLRACRVGGGLCMREKCGCTALPPLLRLSCSTQELLQIALDASPNETLRELFDLGRADAFRWLVLEYMRCEDDLIRRRTAAAKTAPPEQQQAAAADKLGTTRSATASSRGQVVSSAASTTRPADKNGFLTPVLRQRWKSVSGRWGRSGDSSSSAGNSDHRSSSSHSFARNAQGGPGLRGAVGQNHDRALKEIGALPAAAAPPLLLASIERNAAGRSRGTPGVTAAAAPAAAKSNAEEAGEAHASANTVPRNASNPSNSARHVTEEQSSATARQQQQFMMEQAFPAPSASCTLPHSTTDERQESLMERQSTHSIRAPSAAELPTFCTSDSIATPSAALATTCSADERATFAGAVDDTGQAPAAADHTAGQTTKRCVAAAAAESERPQPCEGTLTLQHAATAPAGPLAFSDFAGAAASAAKPTGAVLSEHAVAQRAPPAAEVSSAPAAPDRLCTSLPEGAGAASISEDTDAASFAEEGDIARPVVETGTAALGFQRQGDIPHSNEKQKAQRDRRSIAREFQLAVEKNQCKAMLEKQLAGEFSGSDQRRRRNICPLHGVERQRTRSVPSAAVARRSTVCRRCHAPRVQSDRAVAGLCAICQSEVALLPDKQQGRKPRAELTKPEGLIRKRSTGCAEVDTSSHSGSLESAGNLLPVLLLLKDASLGLRYAHIYTHSNLWNGDGSRCVRPEEHVLSHVVSAQASKKIAN